jgi:hypothetical protein
MEFQVEAYQSDRFDVMPDLRLDHAGSARLQDALGRRNLDAISQLAFEDMDRGSRIASVSCTRRRAGGTVPCVNTGSAGSPRILLGSACPPRSLISNVHHVITQKGFFVLHLAK